MASEAYSSGVSPSDIMNAADWSTEHTFKAFYYKPIVAVTSVVVAKL